MSLHSNSVLNIIAINDNDNNLLLPSFPPNYIEPIIKLVECTGINKNIGNYHSVKATTFFINHFIGITNIKPAGSIKIKITFDTVTNSNICQNSNIHKENHFMATINNLRLSFYVV